MNDCPDCFPGSQYDPFPEPCEKHKKMKQLLTDYEVKDLIKYNSGKDIYHFGTLLEGEEISGLGVADYRFFMLRFGVRHKNQVAPFEQMFKNVLNVEVFYLGEVRAL